MTASCFAFKTDAGSRVVFLFLLNKFLTQIKRKTKITEKPLKMCYVIITGRSLAWLLLSLVAFMFLLVGIMTPKWLLGPPQPTNVNNISGIYVPSVGIYNR